MFRRVGLAIAVSTLGFLGSPAFAEPRGPATPAVKQTVARIDVAPGPAIYLPGVEVRMRGVVRDGKGQPIPSATLGVEDGVARASRTLAVGADGAFEYRATPRVSAFYTVAFVSGRVRSTVTIGVVTSDARARIVSALVPTGPSAGGPPAALTRNGLYCAARGTEGEVTSAMVRVVSEFAAQSIKENLKPSSSIIYVVTALVCAATVAMPAAAPGCAVGIVLSKKAFVAAELAAAAKTIVQFSAKDEAQRNRWNAAVDAGKIAFSTLIAGPASSAAVADVQLAARLLSTGDAVKRFANGSAPGTESTLIQIVSGASKGAQILMTVAQ